MHNCARIEWIAIKMLISSEDQHNQINAQKSASDVMSSDPNWYTWLKTSSFSELNHEPLNQGVLHNVNIILQYCTVHAKRKDYEWLEPWSLRYSKYVQILSLAMCWFFSGPCPLFMEFPFASSGLRRSSGGRSGVSGGVKRSGGVVKRVWGQCSPPTPSHPPRPLRGRQRGSSSGRLPPASPPPRWLCSSFSR